MILKRGEPHQHPVVLERRNAIADGFANFRWHGRSDRCPNLVQSAAGGFRDAGNVVINAFRERSSF